MNLLLINFRIIIRFADGPGDRGSIQGQVISKTQKMVLDAGLLNTQHNKDQALSAAIQGIK